MAEPNRKLVINYAPGEECRVAVVNDGRLDEFHSERRDQVSHVGNIYVGKVTNVEPAIQAAFVDFGLEQAGFLHTSDLHPLYFPGEGDQATERVGKKTARRDRPPIQECLKRGQEIVVQVLKEGVGSKGPSLTSYLSIPGRYLVMMPQMDNVGVSRKVEDDELRAKMKAILDQLELPEGFGFILRTAGLDRTKTELKRDLAYLMRLQRDMERRRKSSTKPRLLYSESDLLLRALRDMLTSDTSEVVIDSEVGLKRANRFMRIFSPRSTTKLIHYTARTPIFHGLHLEEQIRTMYAREVPLPSGGRLVIDETEALVSIDVNSGRSRSAGDSEENAFQTNLEAVDEICRQLRLRDLGGIVVNDLIDMRLAKHRREVEAKVLDLLKNDRARSTVTEINEFGLMSLTRQRMRGSHESQHFHDCPTCRGRGLIQRPDSVAIDALRELAAILDHAKVARAEMVVNPRIAGELLSTRRKHLARIEKQFGKPLLVRLSDAIPLDRVTFYAYDEQGSDLEIDRLPKLRHTADTLKAWIDPASQTEAGSDEFDEVDDDEMPESAGIDPDSDDATDDDSEQHLIEQSPSQSDLDGGENFSLASMVGGRKKRRRRGSRAEGLTPGSPAAGAAASAPAESRERAVRDGPRDGARDRGRDGTRRDRDGRDARRDGRRDGPREARSGRGLSPLDHKPVVPALGQVDQARFLLPPPLPTAEQIGPDGFPTNTPDLMALSLSHPDMVLPFDDAMGLPPLAGSSLTPIDAMSPGGSDADRRRRRRRGRGRGRGEGRDEVRSEVRGERREVRMELPPTVELPEGSPLPPPLPGATRPPLTAVPEGLGVVQPLHGGDDDEDGGPREGAGAGGPGGDRRRRRRGGRDRGRGGRDGRDARPANDRGGDRGGPRGERRDGGGRGGERGSEPGARPAASAPGGRAPGASASAMGASPNRAASPTPATPPASAPAKPAKPPLRTLYGNVKKPLKPGAARGARREE